MPKKRGRQKRRGISTTPKKRGRQKGSVDIPAVSVSPGGNTPRATFTRSEAEAALPLATLKERTAILARFPQLKNKLSGRR